MGRGVEEDPGKRKDGEIEGGGLREGGGGGGMDRVEESQSIN